MEIGKVGFEETQGFVGLDNPAVGKNGGDGNRNI